MCPSKIYLKCFFAWNKPGRNGQLSKTSSFISHDKAQKEGGYNLVPKMCIQILKLLSWCKSHHYNIATAIAKAWYKSPNGLSLIWLSGSEDEM